jgi:solute:Na+ symporter, SSS family
MQLTLLDALIFFGYFFGVVIFAMTVAARSKTKDSSSDYFLASKKLPWYAVGASFVASNISTEHFIGMVGWGFLYGMAVSNWEWGNAVTFTALIWIFLPFYMRGNVATMPEYLERRYNPACRYIYALVMIVGLVIAMLGGVLFAGAKAINVFFPMISLEAGVLLLALAAGAYTVYGGLLSAVWADVLQYCLLMIGGLVVTVFGLYHVGGFQTLLEGLPEKFIMLYPSTHEMIPWSGLLLGLLSVGIWYNCANQFMVQRCLGARSEWDARMGVVMAGFSKALLPFLVVVPGIIAFYLFQDELNDGDRAWPFMVSMFLPAGFVGLVLAGLTSAIMSTLSAITNSSSTIFTLDLYRQVIRKTANDRELHMVGRISAAFIMLIGVGVALLLAHLPGITVFGLIQQTFFYMAAPIAACFLIGILWPGATAAGAIWAMGLGFLVYTPLTRFVLFPQVPWLAPYDTFTHHTFAVLAGSALTLVLVSRFTQRKTSAALEGVIWSRKALQVKGDEGGHGHRGIRSLTLWWALMVASIAGLYTATALYGSRSDVREAEHAAYTVSGGSVEVQRRGALPDFNMWTGSGQLLFRPEVAGDRLTFDLAVEEPGTYAVDLMITRGPGYGPFRAELNGEPVAIQYPETMREEGRFRVVMREVQVYSDTRAEVRPPQTAPHDRPYRMHRLRLGVISAENRRVSLALIAQPGVGPDNLIGVDHLILTARSENSNRMR